MEGESHAHIMNLLQCHCQMRISNTYGSYDNHFDVNINSNHMILDLLPGKYDLEVRVDSSCDIFTKMKTISFDTVDENPFRVTIVCINETKNI